MCTGKKIHDDNSHVDDALLKALIEASFNLNKEKDLRVNDMYASLRSCSISLLKIS